MTPYFTRNSDGTITSTWPDPIANEYPVATDMIREMVATINEGVRVKAVVTAATVLADAYERTEDRNAVDVVWALDALITELGILETERWRP